MSVPALAPEWDPRLVEAAVLAAVRARADEARFHAEREPCYAIAEAESREAAFVALHARWFARLGLDRAFGAALAERPELAGRCGRWLVTAARSADDEAADLLVSRSARPTLVVRAAPETVAAPERATRFLRRELLHVSDMLDPRFGYEPRLPADLAGTPLEPSVRERYRVLWSAYVDGRLVRAGRLPASARTERLTEFRRAFPRLAAATDAAFAGIFDAPALTHGVLLAFAGAPRPHCRVCDLPRHDVEPIGDALPAAARAALARDVPAWRPADGLCTRCAEVYTLHSTPGSRWGTASGSRRSVPD